MIEIRVSNGCGYVWAVRDIQELRVSHHICGLLVGSLPQLGQQNVFLGVPLMLLPEEVVLLVKHKIAVLVDERAAHELPSTTLSSAYASGRARAIEQQQKLTYEQDKRKKNEMEQKYKAEIERKRAQRLAERAAAAAAAATAQADEQQTTIIDINVPDIPDGQETTGPPAVLSPTPNAPWKGLAYTVVIETLSDDAPWYKPERATYATLAEAAQADVWLYPQTPLEEARCRVFEDLWSKGYYMGGGIRFGGDFLIYPGDPLRYHSHFTLTVLADPETAIKPLDIVAYGRLATAVKKSHLLGSWDRSESRCVYFSLEWSSFG